MINFSKKNKTSQTYKDNMRKYKRNMIIGAGLLTAAGATALLARRNRRISTLGTPTNSVNKTISTPSYGKPPKSPTPNIRNIKDLDDYMNS